jgi:hypothetical protein
MLYPFIVDSRWTEIRPVEGIRELCGRVAYALFRERRYHPILRSVTPLQRADGTHGQMGDFAHL